ncbi:MAG: hypothetical protein LUP94_00650 [Candidatus Methanomethylicus sp.]|nr:hypothetical protein [Candidatus Methanomethylicus sp.]
MFISKRAKVSGIIEYEADILGPSVIGEGSLIGKGVIVGYPTRRKVIQIKDRASFEAYDIISDGAIVGEGCIIRPGTIIYEQARLGNNIETGHNVLLREGTEIGDGTRVGTLSVIDGSVKIGTNNNIQTGVYIPPGTVLGSNIFMGPYVSVTNDRYPPSTKISGVSIEDGAAIGCRAVLIAGIRIGEGALVGAGAIVTRDVPPGTVVVGCPAKRVMSREEYDRKQKDYLTQS